MVDAKQEFWSDAIRAFEQGSHAVLEHACRRYLELDPEHFAGRMLLAHALLKMKRFNEASDLLECSDPSDERTVVLWHRTAGDYYAERGDYEAAEDEYASALSLSDEQSEDLVLDLVDAMTNQGRSDAALRAIESFEQRERELEGEASGNSELLAFAKACALRNIGEYTAALDAACVAVGDDEGEGGDADESGFPAASALVAELRERIALTKLALKP